MTNDQGSKFPNNIFVAKFIVPHIVSWQGMVSNTGSPKLDRYWLEVRFVGNQSRIRSSMNHPTKLDLKLFVNVLPNNGDVWTSSDR